MLECAQPEILPELWAEVTAERLDALLRKWLANLPHPFTAADRAPGHALPGVGAAGRVRADLGLRPPAAGPRVL